MPPHPLNLTPRPSATPSPAHTRDVDGTETVRTLTIHDAPPKNSAPATPAAPSSAAPARTCADRNESRAAQHTAGEEEEKETEKEEARQEGERMPGRTCLATQAASMMRLDPRSPTRLWSPSSRLMAGRHSIRGLLRRPLNRRTRDTNENVRQGRRRREDRDRCSKHEQQSNTRPQQPQSKAPGSTQQAEEQQPEQDSIERVLFLTLRALAETCQARTCQPWR